MKGRSATIESGFVKRDGFVSFSEPGAHGFDAAFQMNLVDLAARWSFFPGSGSRRADLPAKIIDASPLEPNPRPVNGGRDRAFLVPKEQHRTGTIKRLAICRCDRYAGLIGEVSLGAQPRFEGRFDDFAFGVWLDVPHLTFE